MSSASDKPVLNDDGTVRRRYELEPFSDGRHWIFATIGLACVNAAILLKNIMFGGPLTLPRPSPPPLEKAPDERAGIDNGISGTLAEQDDAEPEADPDREHEDYAHLILAAADRTHLPDQAHTLHQLHAFRIPVPANANVPLFGAIPGHAISVNWDGSGFLARSRGGPGGTGSVPQPSSQDGTGTDNDHDGSGPGPGGSQPTPYDETDGEGDGPDDPKPVNRRPVINGPVDLGSLLVNHSVVIGLADLLRHASDPDGDALLIQHLTASSGAISARGDGAWLFKPDANDDGAVTFTYAISDGHSETIQTASIDLVDPGQMPIIGTDGDDRIVGTPGDDIILALGGHDVVVGLGGSDVVYGGDGNDRIVTGDGNDVVYSGHGDDVVFAGSGGDIVYGGTGQDVVFGEAGDDVLFGEEGNDVIDGGVGRDLIDGGDGDDQLIAGEDNDTVLGGAGNDAFVVKTVSVATVAAAEPTSVQPTAPVDDGNDVYDGGAGRDTLDLSALTPRQQTPAGQTVADAEETGTAPAQAMSSVEQSTAQATPAAAPVQTLTATLPATIPDVEHQPQSASTSASSTSGMAEAVLEDHTVAPPQVTESTMVVSDTSPVPPVAPVTPPLPVATAQPADNPADKNQTVSPEAPPVSPSETRPTPQGRMATAAAEPDDAVATLNEPASAAQDDTAEADRDTSADCVIDLENGNASGQLIGNDVLIDIEDVICGGGNDTIIASIEQNFMTGGDGDDIFVFHTSASVGNHGNSDRILDFEVGDRIDLQDISREFARAVDSAIDDDIDRFVIIQEQATFSKPGQMKVHYEDLEGFDITIIEGNTDFDEQAEFELQIAGHYDFDSDRDFIDLSQHGSA